MRRSLLIALVSLIVLPGCAAKVDVQTMLTDFDGYQEDLNAVTTHEGAMKALEEGAEKRVAAAEMLEQGMDVEAVPVAERALADAHLALELDGMELPARRAEKCRLEVEQARSAWTEALYLLEQTEEFVGKKGQVETRTPDAEFMAPLLPASTLEQDPFPPKTMAEVSEQWERWREAARSSGVAVADLEAIYRHNEAGSRVEGLDNAIVDQHVYLAARAVQSLESRVRARLSDRSCLEAAQMMSDYGDARADALRATLELERGLQEDLRGQLSQLRSEAQSRQDELYGALSQLEGKFASIRRDARGTIVSLADILFDFDEATLRRDVEFNLVKISTILNQFPEMRVLIEGHTDSVGTEEYNLGLSQRRAQAVQDFLISQDVDGMRMASEGYGESRPVADNDTEEGRQKNRRVDLVIQDSN